MIWNRWAGSIITIKVIAKEIKRSLILDQQRMFTLKFANEITITY